MGWPLLQGLAVGCIVSVASTMVLMRLLMDRGEMSTESGRVMIALTLVEDLVVVILHGVVAGSCDRRRRGLWAGGVENQQGVVCC